MKFVEKMFAPAKPEVVEAENREHEAVCPHCGSRARITPIHGVKVCENEHCGLTSL